MPTLEGTIADALVTVLESNKAAVIADINAAEGGIEAFIANAVNNYKPGGAILPIIWPTIKAAVIAELVSLETQESGAVLFPIIDSEAKTIAKNVGG